MPANDAAHDSRRRPRRRRRRRTARRRRSCLRARPTTPAGLRSRAVAERADDVRPTRAARARRDRGRSGRARSTTAAAGRRAIASIDPHLADHVGRLDIDDDPLRIGRIGQRTGADTRSRRRSTRSAPSSREHLHPARRRRQLAATEDDQTAFDELTARVGQHCSTNSLHHARVVIGADQPTRAFSRAQRTRRSPMKCASTLKHPSTSPRRDVLGRGVRERRITGPEVERGDAARREARDVGPSELRPHREIERADELGDERMRRGSGGAAGRGAEDLDVVGAREQRARLARPRRRSSGSARSGG